MASAGIDFRNDTTPGFVGREVRMLSYGVNTYTRTSPVTPGLSLTATLTVYAPNGKLATPTRSVTT